MAPTALTGFDRNKTVLLAAGVKPTGNWNETNYNLVHFIMEHLVETALAGNKGLGNGHPALCSSVL
jgi:hypothetical protein